MEKALDAARVGFGYKNLTKGEKDILASSLADSNAGEGEISLDAKGNPIPDTAQRETETIPLVEDAGEYFAREVTPYDADAWIDESKTKIGYEVLFNRYFYKKETGRTLDVIEAELEAKVAAIAELLGLHVVETNGSVVEPDFTIEPNVIAEEVN
jgi:type I restriction enzyme M protein